MTADLEQLPEFVREHQLAKLPDADSADDDYESAHVETENIGEAHIVLSFSKETRVHRPVLDIDFPVAVLPSSTPGHFHLYIDKPLSWSKYRRLLMALADAGIIEDGYASVSMDREYTSVRLPWVKKKTPPTPAVKLPDPPDRSGMEWATEHDERL